MVSSSRISLTEGIVASSYATGLKADFAFGTASLVDSTQNGCRKLRLEAQVCSRFHWPSIWSSE
jgi:hypothetical protein